MSIYLCCVCGLLIDDDYFPCSEYKDELICPDCLDNLQELTEDQENELLSDYT